MTAVDVKTSRSAAGSFMSAASVRSRAAEENRSEEKSAKKSSSEWNLTISTATSHAQMAEAHWTSGPPMG